MPPGPGVPAFRLWLCRSAAAAAFGRDLPPVPLPRGNVHPPPADCEALLAPTPGREPGSVVLVGAGPGNPELLTLRAVRALQSAGVILVDDLGAPGILDFARREAKKMLVGKTGFEPSCEQDEINGLMISLAKA